MIKYTDAQVTFREFPDESSLCINITNCPFRCPGCHSPELWEDIGTELDTKELDKLIQANRGITCVGFMGGEPKEVNTLAFYLRHYTTLNIGWYTGYDFIPEEIYLPNFDYIKLGPYIKEKGGLDNPNTNQRMYKFSPFFSEVTIGGGWRDITSKFYGKS